MKTTWSKKDSVLAVIDGFVLSSVNYLCDSKQKKNRFEWKQHKRDAKREKRSVAVR